MIIEVHNIQEYKDSIDKCIGYGRYFSRNAVCLSWKLRTSDEFLNPEIREIFKSNVSICDEALELLGKPIIYVGHEIGILRGVEITEEDFYWIIEKVGLDVDDHEVSLSCVGRIDYLDPELVKSATKYYEVESVNNTKLNIAFIMGGIWMQQHPSKEMIKKIISLYDNQHKLTEEEINTIRNNYK